MTSGFETGCTSTSQFQRSTTQTCRVTTAGEDHGNDRLPQGRRARLGVDCPRETVTAAVSSCPATRCTTIIKRGSGKQPVAATMASFALFKGLLKDENIGARWVPIIPDGARHVSAWTRCSRRKKIYTPDGPVSICRWIADLFLSVQRRVRPARSCTRASPRQDSSASSIACGSSCATHGDR